MFPQANKAQLLAHYEECLKKDQRFQIKLHGNCMWPVVRSGDLLTIEKPSLESLAFGDVAILKTSHETLHANIQFTPKTKIQKNTLMQKNYFGKVTKIQRKDKEIDLAKKTLLQKWAEAFISPANPYLLGLPKTILSKLRFKR